MTLGYVKLTIRVKQYQTEMTYRGYDTERLGNAEDPGMVTEFDFT